MSLYISIIDATAILLALIVIALRFAVPADHFSKKTSRKFSKVSSKMGYELLGREQRIQYWTHKLWVLADDSRNLNGDALFNKDLVKHMRSIDSEIDGLLPEILRRLADLQNRHSIELIEAFNRQTGMNVP